MDLDSRCTEAEVGKEIFAVMPSLSQACRLCDIFLEYGQFAYVVSSGVLLVPSDTVLSGGFPYRGSSCSMRSLVAYIGDLNTSTASKP